MLPLYYLLLPLLTITTTTADLFEPPKINHNCTYHTGIDYHGITGHVLGRSNRTHCCQACTRDHRCHVAVLSSPEDDPPNECWLKFGALAQVAKENVTACVPAGREFSLVLVADGDEDGIGGTYVDTRGRRRRRHQRRHRILTPAQKKLQKRASGTLLILLVVMIAGQMLIFWWKKNHYHSFQKVTLVGLFVFPYGLSIYNHWWRFVTLSTAFTCVTGYYVKLATTVPLDTSAPRKVYVWFHRVYTGCLSLGFLGYILLMCELTGLRIIMIFSHIIAEIATMSLFYGLYFGVLGRDVAELCSHAMNQSMGYTKKDDDEPQRLLPPNICALCGLELNKELEQLIEGQDFAMVERHQNRYGSYHDRRGLFGQNRTRLVPYGARDNEEERAEREGAFTKALRPERIVKLKCGHEFHEFCVRGWSIVGKNTVCPNCGEKVDVRSVLGGAAWEKNPNLIWGQLLDALRYLIVWNPIIMLFVRFSIYEVDSHGGF